MKWHIQETRREFKLNSSQDITFNGDETPELTVSAPAKGYFSFQLTMLSITNTKTGKAASVGYMYYKVTSNYLDYESSVQVSLGSGDNPPPSTASNAGVRSPSSFTTNPAARTMSFLISFRHDKITLHGLIFFCFKFICRLNPVFHGLIAMGKAPNRKLLRILLCSICALVNLFEIVL